MRESPPVPKEQKISLTSISEQHRKLDVRVLVFDAGADGLTLAIDLGRHRIDVLIVEKQLRASRLPKM